MKAIQSILILALAAATFYACGEKESDGKTADKPNSAEEKDTSSVEQEDPPLIQFTYRQLSVNEFAQYVEDPKAFVLDVRTAEEVAETGMIPGAGNIDWNDEQFLDHVEESIKKDASLYLYCHGGGRGAEASEALIERGYQNVYNLKNGLASWIEDGREVKK